MKIKSISTNQWQKKKHYTKNSKQHQVANTIYDSINIGRQSWLNNFTFFIHNNAFLRKTISKAMTRPNQSHMCIDQGNSSVFVNWTKQVCLQTRLKWWQWWGTPDIIWNTVSGRRWSKRKWTITKCCLTVCWSIKKRHGVWAGASVVLVQWLSMQHVSDIWWCSTAVAVVAQTSYFVCTIT